MKYLVTVLVIVLAVSALTMYVLWPDRETGPEEILVIINGHAIPRSILEQKKNLRGYHDKDEQAILDTIIINDLLLQEAQRLGIDREPAFRAAVQEYYEQSLIKILIDRQFSGMNISATDEELEQYLENHDKLFTYTRISKKGGQVNEQEKTVLFDDLSDSLKFLLGYLEPGETATDYSTGNEMVSYRLDRVAPGMEQTPLYEDRELIRRKITNFKKEKALRDWIRKLRDQAVITTPDGGEKP